MQPEATSPLRLAELVMALSLATDLGTGQPMEHALRVCLLATELSGDCGLDESERADIYYIALLAESMPNARLVELHGSGHVTYFERSAQFAAAIESFALTQAR